MRLSLTLTLTLILYFPSLAYCFLVKDQSNPNITYNGGPLLSDRSTIDLVIVWYGEFSNSQRKIVVDFLNSMKETSATPMSNYSVDSSPTVRQWWETTTLYKDHKGSCVAPHLKLVRQISNRYSLGRRLKAYDVQSIALQAMVKFSNHISLGVYIVFTSSQVVVENFCESKCATHATIQVSNVSVPYIWVGDSGTQCPGQCAWPFAIPEFMASHAPRKAPNDVGIDGLIINLATILAGVVTNPHGNAYYQGNPQVPLEIGTACTGIFGPGSYPGHPGTLLIDSSGSSYNAIGNNNQHCDQGIPPNELLICVADRND